MILEVLRPLQFKFNESAVLMAASSPAKHFTSLRSVFDYVGFKYNVVHRTHQNSSELN